MTPHARLRAAIAAAVKEHGSLKPAARAIGIDRDTMRRVLRDPSYRPRAQAYRRLGLPLPADRDPKARLREAYAAISGRCEKIRVRDLARAARCNWKEASDFRASQGLSPLRRKSRDDEPCERWLPSPPEIAARAAEVKAESLAATRDKRPRPASPSGGGDWRPRVYRVTRSMVV